MIERHEVLLNSPLRLILVFIIELMNGQQPSYSPMTLAGNGLKNVVKRFLHPQQQQPDIAATPEMVQLLRQAKKDKEMDDTATSRYNTAAMTHWVVKQLEVLNPVILQLDSSPFSVALFLLTLMELSQLLRALATPEVANVSKLKIALQHQVQEARQRCKALIKEIRGKECILISQNTEKSRDVLLLSRNEAVEKSEVLLSPLLQLDLHCAYSNLLLNLRRVIRHTWQSREAELRHRFRSLKILQIILYYLSAATFAPAENLVRVMANDILSADRQVTFVHLIHDEDGLRKLGLYLQEAPLSDLEEDIDFLSNLITRRP